MRLKNSNRKGLISKKDNRFIFFDYLPEAYLALDSSLNIIWANKKFLSITNYTLNEIVDVHIQTFFPDYHPDCNSNTHSFITTPVKIENVEYFLVKFQVREKRDEDRGSSSIVSENKNRITNQTESGSSINNFQKILSIITEVCFKLDANHNIIYANNAACQTWDKKEKEVIGENIFSLLDDIYLPVKVLLELATNSGDKVSKEIYLSKIDRWIFINIHPEDAGLIVLHSDITEKIKFRDNLQQKETQLLTLIENVPDLVTRWSSDIKLLFANTSFSKAKINSFIKEQIESKTTEKIKSLDWVNDINQVFKTGATLNHHTTLPTKEGVAYLESSIIPEKNPEGKVESVLIISRDVTENRLSAKKILDTKNFLQSVFDASVNGILALESVRNTGSEIIDFKCVLSNNSSCKILGYDPTNLLLSSVIDNKQLAIYFDKLKNLVEDAKRIEDEIYYNYQNSNIWLHIIIEKLNNGLLLTFSDITQRKEAEKETVRALKLMQDLIDGSPIILIHYKINRDIDNGIQDFTILNSNENASKLIGLTRAELKEKKLSETIPSAFSKEFGRNLKDFASYNSPERFETCYSQCGEDSWWDVALVKRDDGIILTALNITDKVRSERKVRALQKQQHAKLLNAVMQTQEEERRRVAESLHNDFGQLLNLALINVSKENKNVTDLLNQAIKKMRNISYELMPPLLKDFGLEVALKDMFEIKLLSSGIKINYALKGFNKRIHSDLEVAIYRIVQEILNNTIKHAAAEEIKISINNNLQKISITTEDNGRGFNPGTNKLGFGLRYISNRVSLLKGVFNIESAPNSGTKCIIVIPVKEETDTK